MADGSLLDAFRSFVARPISVRGAAVLAVVVLALTTLFPLLQAGDKPLSVSQLIREVKTELQKAEQERLQKNELALFELQDFEMQIHYIVRNSGGISAEVVGVGTKADIGTEHVQKLTLRWKAVPAQEKRIAPSDFSSEPDVILPAIDVPVEGGKR